MVATEENKNILKMNKAAVQLFLNEYLIWLAIDGVVSNVKSWNHYDVLKTKMNNLLVRSGQRSYDAAEENKSNYVFKKMNKQLSRYLRMNIWYGKQWTEFYCK